MIPIVDLHCDTIMALYADKEKRLLDNDLQIDVNKLIKGGYLAQVFAMFVFLKDNPNPFKTCNEMIDVFYHELEINKNKINVALNYDELINNNSTFRSLVEFSK